MWGQWDAGDKIVADLSDLQIERFSDYINYFKHIFSSYKGPPLKVKRETSLYIDNEKFIVPRFLEINNDLSD